MGVSMLKMDRAKAKWRVKLQRAFSGKGKPASIHPCSHHALTEIAAVDKGAKTGKYVLFILPLITVLREGEACLSAN